MVPVAAGQNLRASLSVDLSTGWNLHRKPVQQLVRDIVIKRKPSTLIVTPPCTMFSKMLHINKMRMDQQKLNARLTEGHGFLKYSMSLCSLQYDQGRKFVFEHPAGASSFKEACVKRIMKLPGVAIARFDQCRFGLKSPSQKPMKKRTVLMTNCMHTHQLFDQKWCNCGPGVKHQVIEGHEAGVQLSSYASAYPDMMVSALVRGVSQSLSDHC
eukprot:6674772-Pyramimonas_sp.AAC.1